MSIYIFHLFMSNYIYFLYIENGKRGESKKEEERRKRREKKREDIKFVQAL
jgi:hypothetical protein